MNRWKNDGPTLRGEVAGSKVQLGEAPASHPTALLQRHTAGASVFTNGMG